MNLIPVNVERRVGGYNKTMSRRGLPIRFCRIKGLMRLCVCSDLISILTLLLSLIFCATFRERVNNPRDVKGKGLIARTRSECSACINHCFVPFLLTVFLATGPIILRFGGLPCISRGLVPNWCELAYKPTHSYS